MLSAQCGATARKSWYDIKIYQQNTSYCFKKMLVFFTDPNQNWCTIRVDVSENAVTCPGSELALKVKVLKKAADLAAKERTTVRIPISTQGEVKNFGVYAVPGLETHVFVGPFTSKNEEISDNDDIVCLDDDENSDGKVVNIMEPMVIIFFSVPH